MMKKKSKKADLSILFGGYLDLTQENIPLLPAHVFSLQEGSIQKITKATKDWKKKSPAKKYIDASHLIASPGLINAHTHLAMTLFRGLAEDMEFQRWLHDYIFPIESQLVDREFVKVGTDLGLWESLLAGVTTMADMYYFMDVVADRVDKAGLRALIGQTVMDLPVPDDKKKTGEAYKILTAMISKYKKNPRITPCISPHAPYTCSDETYIKAANFAKENNIPLHTHVSETRFEVEESLKTFQKTPIERLHKLGVFKAQTIIAHGVHVTDSEMGVLREYGVGVIHNPESNMKIKAGVAPIKKYLHHKVRLGIGTDGAASNNNLNLLQELGSGARLQKLQNAPEETSARDFFRMATLGGAKALGLEKEIGSLEVGKRADIVGFNLNQPHLLPLHDVVNQLVYASSGLEAELVLCDGKVLLEDGEPTQVNTTRLQKDALLWKNKIQKFLKSK